MSALNNLLADLNLKGMQTALDRQLENPHYGELPFEERLSPLLLAEASERASRKISRNLKAAKFKDRSTRTEDIDYHMPRGLDKSVMLSLIGGDYLARKQNILITGYWYGKEFHISGSG